ncbi:hypothetical protein [Streptomyces sp. NPDC005438]|uniref:hypothetical protein n=1 Tax=Streptomyces sp. NPDC005438 TaxID=3156880 RepID=UPI0033B39A19
MTGEHVRALLSEVARTERRQDTGPPSDAVPDGGSHFVTMVKPEVMTGTAAQAVLTEVLRVLAEGEATARRCVLVPARDFAQRGGLLLHYPRLHRVAADGTQALTTAAHGELATLQGETGATEVLGAFEALAHDAHLTPTTLDERFRERGVHRLGSGSYAAPVEVNGCLVTVLNGFLPALAAGYGAPSALVALIECHSSREIADLRSGLLGTLDPTAAEPGSLRGAVHLAAEREGIRLSEGSNGVHLSAGHLEAMFQVWRYFSAADGAGMEATALGRSLEGRGVPASTVTALATDQNLRESSGEQVSPHGATENLRRDEVLDRVGQWTSERRSFQI